MWWLCWRKKKPPEIWHLGFSFCFPNSQVRGACSHFVDFDLYGILWFHLPKCIIPLLYGTPKGASFSRCTCTIAPYFSLPFCHTDWWYMLHCKTSSKGVIINCKFDGSTLALEESLNNSHNSGLCIIYFLKYSSTTGGLSWNFVLRYGHKLWNASWLFSFFSNPEIGEKGCPEIRIHDCSSFKSRDWEKGLCPTHVNDHLLQFFVHANRLILCQSHEQIKGIIMLFEVAPPSPPLWDFKIIQGCCAWVCWPACVAGVCMPGWVFVACTTSPFGPNLVFTSYIGQEQLLLWWMWWWC